MEDRKIQRMSPADKKKHQETVRNEGILVAQQPGKKKEMLAEISLEIEDPGAAAKVAEEGAITIKESEFSKFSK